MYIILSSSYTEHWKGCVYVYLIYYLNSSACTYLLTRFPTFIPAWIKKYLIFWLKSICITRLFRNKEFWALHLALNSKFGQAVESQVHYIGHLKIGKIIFENFELNKNKTVSSLTLIPLKEQYHERNSIGGRIEDHCNTFLNLLALYSSRNHFC